MNGGIQDEKSTRRSIRELTRRVAGVLGVVLFASTVYVRPAHAQTYSVLYSFQCAPNDGRQPLGALVRDAQGNLYGTTSLGGASDFGTVFQLTPAGAETVLYSFTGGLDGKYPEAGLLLDPAGNLYGTTEAGGTSGLGVVFKLAPAGKETVLHSFAGSPADGDAPAGGVVRDTAGNLYGTTVDGGTFNLGVVFKLAGGGKETVLHSFSGSPGDGERPGFGSLVLDAQGNLYGATGDGGTDGTGTVYRISPAGVETVLYSFPAGSAGAYPVSALVVDGSGNLYGATYGGGLFRCSHAGCGTVFALSPTGVETVLHRFDGPPTDGEGPMSGVFRDRGGNLFGTTTVGGSGSGVCAPEGCGVVYELSATGKERVLYSFTGPPNDGAAPDASLIRDSAGNFYGTTASGGSGPGPEGQGCGTVFKITP